MALLAMRVRADLLAIAPQDTENCLRPMPSVALFCRNRVHAALGRRWGQAPDIDRHYGVYREERDGCTGCSRSYSPLPNARKESA